MIDRTRCPLRALAASLRANRYPSKAYNYDYEIASPPLHYTKPRLLVVTSKKDHHPVSPQISNRPLNPRMSLGVAPALDHSIPGATLCGGWVGRCTSSDNVFLPVVSSTLAGSGMRCDGLAVLTPSGLGVSCLYTIFDQRRGCLCAYMAWRSTSEGKSSECTVGVD